MTDEKTNATLLAVTHLEEASAELAETAQKHEPTIKELATFLATSGLIKKELRGKPADVAVVLMGADAYKVDRFVGLQDGFDIIQGRLAFTAAMQRALCQRSPICEYFVEVEQSAEKSVWETKRRNHPKPDRATFTLEDASTMGYLNKDNWQKQAKVMLSARASSKLCRQVYSDLLFGMTYSSEELMDEGGKPTQVIDVELVPDADATKEDKLAAAINAAKHEQIAEAVAEEIDAVIERVSLAGIKAEPAPEPPPETVPEQDAGAFDERYGQGKIRL